MVLNPQRIHCVRKGPQLLRFPLRFTPFALKKPLLQSLLRWQFQQPLAEGEPDFLEARWLGIEVSDLGLRWSVTLEQGRLQVANRETAYVWFRAEANDLLLISARRVDPDTLFFQRRVIIEGDSELGLEVKNLMEAVDLQSMPTPLRIGLMQPADVVEAGLNEGAISPAGRVGATC